MSNNNDIKNFLSTLILSMIILILLMILYFLFNMLNGLMLNAHHYEDHLNQSNSCLVKEYEWKLVNNNHNVFSEIKDKETGEVIQELKLVEDTSRQRVLVDKYYSINCSMVN